ncbi:MAG: H+transporting two-sector ATPase C subunit [Magnetococcales bacterium]|nr:H+transporting two-sector ATPase C subunit [Magnetococcales bacterium]
MSPRTKVAFAMTVFTAILAGAITWVFGGMEAMASVPAGGQATGAGGFDPAMGYMAAALATGLSSLAAGIAVGQVGAAVVGAVTEKPEMMGRMLILVGLAEGIAIYGLIISILILNRLG